MTPFTCLEAVQSHNATLVFKNGQKHNKEKATMIYEIVREQIIGYAISKELADEVIKDYRKAIPVDDFKLYVRKQKQK